MTTLVAIAVALLLALGWPGHESSALRVKEPFVNQTDVVGAFRILRRAGLRVSIPESFTVESLHVPAIKGALPHGGTLVEPGTTVSLQLWAGPLGSPGICEPMPSWTVENVVGLTVHEALRRLPRCFFYTLHLPPLDASDAPTLFDAYRVVAQTPGPGTVLRPADRVGHGVRLNPFVLEAEPR